MVYLSNKIIVISLKLFLLSIDSILSIIRNSYIILQVNSPLSPSSIAYLLGRIVDQIIASPLSSVIVCHTHTHTHVRTTHTHTHTHCTNIQVTINKLLIFLFL